MILYVQKHSLVFVCPHFLNISEKLNAQDEQDEEGILCVW